MRPRIGITSGLGGPVWSSNGTSWRPYAEAVERAGGEAVHLGAGVRGHEARVLGELQAVLFSGGNDIDLAMYPNPPMLNGEDPVEVMQRFRMTPEADRDAYELPLIAEALQQDLPILGICRGCQVLNVALGGRLILDIPQEVKTDLQHGSCPKGGVSGRHTVKIHPESLLAGILPPHESTECNSRHHQAVLLDESFTARIAAISPDDGVVEAIEVEGRRWAIGVQWHPEHANDHDIRERYEPLFQAFVAAASA